MEEFIILRTQDLVVPDIGGFGEAMPRTMGRGREAIAESLEVVSTDLSKPERDDLRRDPRTLAIAKPMPLGLIAPTKSSEPSAASLVGGMGWGISAVGADTSPFDGRGIAVAVLDTGIDPDHAAFAGIHLVRKNFTSEIDDDTNGHGTHCAGTIFGRDVDGFRIGVARGVERAIIGKVLGADGGSSATLMDAILWAVREGAQIISMSLGIDYPGYVKRLTDNGVPVEMATSIALEQYRANVNLFSSISDVLVRRNAFRDASLIIAASGNESRRPNFEIATAPPAAASGILSVGALAKGGTSGRTVARFSNTQCNISAPGVDVISAKTGGGLISFDGTSMATPHVAGVAALWAQRQMQSGGGVLSDVLMGQLLANCDRSTLKPGLHREDVGEGIIQAPQN